MTRTESFKMVYTNVPAEEVSRILMLLANDGYRIEQIDSTSQLKFVIVARRERTVNL
jgi:hypothetical protein